MIPKPVHAAPSLPMTWEDWLKYLAIAGYVYEYDENDEEPFAYKRYNKREVIRTSRFASRRALIARLRSYARILLRDEFALRRDADFVIDHGHSDLMYYRNRDGAEPEAAEPLAEAACRAHWDEARNRYRKLSRDDLMEAAQLLADQFTTLSPVKFSKVVEQRRAERSAALLEGALQAIEPSTASVRTRL